MSDPHCATNGTWDPEEPDRVVRQDRYTVLIDGHRVRADARQEQNLRAMDGADLDRFLRVMGYARSTAPWWSDA